MRPAATHGVDEPTCAGVSGDDPEVLARRAAGGDADAFAALCHRYRDDVWRYCRALLGDREQAFDAAQDTFLRAVRAIRRFRSDAPVRVWLLVLARRAVADLIRAEQRRRGRDAGNVPPDRPVSAATGVVELRQLVDGLPAEQREAFLLTQVVGLPYEDAAVVAGVAVGTMKSRVHRARQRLATALEED